MANNTVVKIQASRKLRITKVVSASRLRFANYDLSTVEPGSILMDKTGNIANITEVIGQEIVYVNVDPAVFSIKDEVTIQSVFRYADSELTIYEVGRPYFYEGRLFSNSINESLGDMLEKNQVVSSSNIKLRNSDLLMSNIFHTYDLTNAKIDIHFGTSDQLSSYSLIFSGVTTSKSNFQYNESSFSFNAKDDRSNLLDTKITNGKYLEADYPVFDSYDIGSPISSLTLTTNVSATWVPGTIITKVGVNVPVARVSYIDPVNPKKVYIYNYTGTFIVGNSVVALGVTAVINLVTDLGPIGWPLKGDNGHFIGNFDDLTDNVVAVQTPSFVLASMLPVPGVFGLPGFSQNIVDLNVNVTNTLKGYVNSVTFNVDASFTASIVSADLIITTPTSVLIKPLRSSDLDFTGPKTIDLKADAFQIQGQDIGVVIRINSVAPVITIEGSHIAYTVSSVNLHIQKRASASGSFTNIIPINFAGNVPISAGSLVYSSSNNNLISIDISASTDGITFTSLGLNVSSGFIVPLLLAGSTIIMVKLIVNISASSNFLNTINLNSTVIAYPLSSIAGSILPSNFIGKGIPIIYGDFTNTLVPAALISTSTTTLTGNHVFSAPVASGSAGTGPNTGSMHFTATAGAQQIIIGDSVKYIGLISNETVIVKVTQVLGSNTVGEVYFEDLGVVPNYSATPVVRRVTNKYKVSATELKSIVDYYFKPSSGDTQPIAPTTTISTTTLAIGEFELIGISPSDEVFVHCTGKPDPITGILITDAISILQDISVNYLNGISISIDPLVLAEISVIPLRLYLDAEETFSTIHTKIQQSVNLSSSISPNKAINLFRLNSSIKSDFSYYKDQIVVGTLEEQYDPNSIVLSGMAVKYNYNPITAELTQSIDVGTNVISSIDLPYIVDSVSAIKVAQDMLDIMSVPPEIVHATIKASDVQNVNLGDILYIENKDSIHNIVVQQYIKSPNSGTIEVYGLNLSNDYTFGYRIPVPAIFPDSLLARVKDVWGNDKLYTSPGIQTLVNPTWDDISGNLSVNMGFNTFINSAQLPINNLPAGIGFVYTLDGVNDIMFASSEVLSLPGSTSNVTLNLNAINSVMGAYISIATVPIANVALLVGNKATDAPLFNSALTIALSVGIITTPITNYTITAPPESSIVIYLSSTAATLLTVDSWTMVGTVTDANAVVLNIVDPVTNAIRLSVSRGNPNSFKQWNTNWPIELKDYVTERYVLASILPNGTIVNSNGDIETNIKSKVIL